MRLPAGIAHEAYKPLLQILDSLLLTPEEVADHWRLSRSRLAGLRQTGKGVPHVRLPTGTVRYRASDVIGQELAGTSGPLTLPRVLLAISACSGIAEADKAIIMQHLRKAFPDK